MEVSFGVWVGKYELPYPRIKIQNERKHRAFDDRSSPGANTEARLLNGRQPKSMSAVLRDEGSVAGPGSLTQRQPTTDSQQPTTTNKPANDQRSTTNNRQPPPTTYHHPSPTITNNNHNNKRNNSISGVILFTFCISHTHHLT